MGNIGKEKIYEKKTSLPSTERRGKVYSCSMTLAEMPVFIFAAGWSSPVAREAHNLEVAGSNPVPATVKKPLPSFSDAGVFLEDKRMASGLIGNEVPLTGLRVRVPCPPL